MGTDQHRTQATATQHAERVLVDLGLDPRMLVLEEGNLPHPDQDWARSGASWLTGSPNASPRPMHAPVAACARGVGLALAALEAESAAPAAARAGASRALAAIGHDAPALLGERAALAGLGREGRATAGGAGRLLRARDGWMAAQLPRADDFEALPAWLEVEAPQPLEEAPQSPEEAPEDPVRGEGAKRTEVFAWLERAVALRSRAVLVERARLLGLAVAPLAEPMHGNASEAAAPPAPPPVGPWLVHRPSRGAAARPRPRRSAPARPTDLAALRVLDLSTLWAGPLCGSLLALAGADVVKVEHPARPDGARFGPRAFFDLMNGGKSNVALDVREAPDRARLRALIEAADVVIESARPRGLAQLGIDAEAWVDALPRLTWISITGYGRAQPGGDWIAFGDDAAVAGGLVARDAAGEPVFCGDAVADPLTGMHAAVAALAGVRTGGGLYDISLAGVARMVAETRRAEPATDDPESWPVARPRTRTPAHAARAIGADTSEVLERWCPSARGARRC